MLTSSADPDGVLEGVLISEQELRARVHELGAQVSRDYAGLDPLLVAVLKGAVILNAVKCLPPANKPEPREIATCRNYFEAALGALPRVRVLIALGQIAHVAAARALGLPPSSTKFGHGAENVAPGGRILLSSYHCSRYNQNTNRLNAAMFESVFERAMSLG